MLVEKKRLLPYGYKHKLKHKMAAVMGETKDPKPSQILLGIKAEDIEKGKLKQIASNSVGYIYIKGEPIVHGTGFICAKKRD